MSRADFDTQALGEMEQLRQHFLTQARSLLFSNPTLAAEAREKAMMLQRLAQQSRRRGR